MPTIISDSHGWPTYGLHDDDERDSVAKLALIDRADANGETVDANARGTGEQGGERRRAWRSGSKTKLFFV
jgi:hypothetical protein